jgi:hypothetical protein
MPDLTVLPYLSGRGVTSSPVGQLPALWSLDSPPMRENRADNHHRTESPHALRLG